jgi:hypothetical protein
VAALGIVLGPTAATWAQQDAKRASAERVKSREATLAELQRAGEDPFLAAFVFEVERFLRGGQTHQPDGTEDP